MQWFHWVVTIYSPSSVILGLIKLFYHTWLLKLHPQRSLSTWKLKKSQLKTEICWIVSNFLTEFNQCREGMGGWGWQAVHSSFLSHKETFYKLCLFIVNFHFLQNHADFRKRNSPVWNETFQEYMQGPKILLLLSVSICGYSVLYQDPFQALRLDWKQKNNTI